LTYWSSACALPELKYGRSSSQHSHMTSGASPAIAWAIHFS
jgi:hypothetical protein